MCAWNLTYMLLLFSSVPLWKVLVGMRKMLINLLELSMCNIPSSKCPSSWVRFESGPSSKILAGFLPSLPAAYFGGEMSVFRPPAFTDDKYTTGVARRKDARETTDFRSTSLGVEGPGNIGCGCGRSCLGQSWHMLIKVQGSRPSRAVIHGHWLQLWFSVVLKSTSWNIGDAGFSDASQV